MIEVGWVDPARFRAATTTSMRSTSAGTLDIDAYVAFADRAVRARSADELEAGRARFMREVIVPALHPAALALVASHRDRGDRSPSSPPPTTSSPRRSARRSASMR